MRLYITSNVLSYSLDGVLDFMHGCFFLSLNLIFFLVLQRMHGPRRMLSWAPQLLPKGCAGPRLLLQYSGSDSFAVIRPTLAVIE